VAHRSFLLLGVLCANITLPREKLFFYIRFFQFLHPRRFYTNPDQQAVLDRLLRNQQDIGHVIKPYYGEEAGNKLAELLREHILIAGRIVEAAMAGNQPEVQKLQKDWHRNADEIARFLSDANPNWTFKELQDMLYTHLALITEVVVQCLQGNWEADIAATDKNEIHMLHLADILTEGIIKQFPDQFQ